MEKKEKPYDDAVAAVAKTHLQTSIKELTMKIYIPFMIIGTVYQGGNTLVPLFLKLRFNSKDSFIGFAATIASLGNLLASVPAGKAIEKFGTRATQLSSLALFVTAYLIGGFIQLQELILITQFLVGVGFCQYHLTQHAFLSGNVPSLVRGKAMAGTGGVHRIAGIVGPLLVALFAETVGLQTTFFCMIPFMILNFLWQYINFSDKTSDKHLLERRNKEANSSNDDTHPLRMSTLNILYDFRHTLLRICIYCMLLTFVRYGRVLMIPLFGLSLNLSVTEIAVISSASYFSGAIMFPISGFIMDRFGRKKNAFTTTFIMAIGFLVMFLSTNFGSLLAAGVLIGLGNGLSSGLVMTLGGDLAPEDKRRGPFLGVYKLLNSTGQLIGPVIAGYASDIFGVQGGAIVCLVVALLASAWVIVFIQETRKLSNAADDIETAKENPIVSNGTLKQ